MREDNPAKKMFERQVYTEDAIKKEDLHRFQVHVKKRAQVLLEELDNWLSLLEKPSEKDEKVKTGLGIYHYVEQEEIDSKPENI